MSIVIQKIEHTMTVKHESGTFEKFGAEALVVGDAAQAAAELKDFVLSQLSDGAVAIAPKTQVDPSVKIKTDGTMVKEPKEEEVVEEKPAKRTRRTKAQIEAEAAQEEKAAEEAPEAKEEPKPSKVKSKSILYSRDDEGLKSRLVEILHTEYPGWKEDKVMLAAAKKTSLEAEGQEFLDSTGEVLESFMDFVKATMESDDL